MSPTYLITLSVIGCFSLIALWPVRRPRLLAQVSYFLGLTANEVPHLAVGLPLATYVGQAIASEDIGTDLVAVLFVVGVIANVAAIIAIARRGVRAWPAVTSAAREATIDVPPQPRWWTWRTLLTPVPFRRRRIVRIAGLRYGDHRRQRLDVYHRRDRPLDGPVLVYLHGGGYHSGGKHREGRGLLHQLADRGWVCISADYRLRPTARFEEHLADARGALAWARDHAGEYGGDPDRVVMAGSSAGAHLTSLLALDPDTELTAAICLYGYYGRYDDRPEHEQVISSPFALPADRAPAFFLAHGDHDTWTPVHDARRLAAKLRRESTNPVVMVELPGAQHGFDLWRSWRYSAVLAGIESFVADPRVAHRPPHAASHPTPRKEPT